jgi:hypothetical protein
MRNEKAKRLNKNWLPGFLGELAKCGYKTVRFTAQAWDGRYSGMIECYFPVSWENTKREPSLEQPRPEHFNRPALWELLDKHNIRMGCGNGSDGVHQAQWDYETCPIEHLPDGMSLGSEFVLSPCKAKLGRRIFLHDATGRCRKCGISWKEIRVKHSLMNEKPDEYSINTCESCDMGDA